MTHAQAFTAEMALLDEDPPGGGGNPAHPRGAALRSQGDPMCPDLTWERCEWYLRGCMQYRTGQPIKADDVCFPGYTWDRAQRCATKESR